MHGTIGSTAALLLTKGPSGVRLPWQKLSSRPRIYALLPLGWVRGPMKAEMAKGAAARPQRCGVFTSSIYSWATSPPCTHRIVLCQAPWSAVWASATLVYVSHVVGLSPERRTYPRECQDYTRRLSAKCVSIAGQTGPSELHGIRPSIGGMYCCGCRKRRGV